MSVDYLDDDYEDAAVGLKPGPGLIMLSAALVCACLSVALFTISANAFYPSIEDSPVSMQDMAQAQSVEPQGEVSDNESEVLVEGASNADCAVSDHFPPRVLQWCELITRYANRRGLSPDLVAALIWQESGGDPQAYSRSGAVGLMQVMPRDGLAASFMCPNGPCFSNRPTIEQLKDPEFNIAYGTKMLAGLLSRYGDMREALKHYGPANVGYYYADKVMKIYRNFGNLNRLPLSGD